MYKTDELETYIENFEHKVIIAFWSIDVNKSDRMWVFCVTEDQEPSKGHVFLLKGIYRIIILKGYSPDLNDGYLSPICKINKVCKYKYYSIMGCFCGMTPQNREILLILSGCYWISYFSSQDQHAHLLCTIPFSTEQGEHA